MMDWRTVMADVAADYRKAINWTDAVFRHITESRPAVEREFGAAILECLDGESESLIEWLDSDRPLPNNFREGLAMCIHFLVTPESKRRGRPPNIDEQNAAECALAFYQQCRRTNAALGVKDYGHSPEMKNEAVRVVLDARPEFKGLDPWRVRERLERLEKSPSKKPSIVAGIK